MIFLGRMQEGVLAVTDHIENDAGLTLQDLKLLFHGDGNQILTKVLLP